MNHLVLIDFIICGKTCSDLAIEAATPACDINIPWPT